MQALRFVSSLPPPPPWCTKADHVAANKKIHAWSRKKRTAAEALQIGSLESPSQRLRRRINTPNEISHQRLRLVDDALEEAEKEHDEGNRLGSMMSDSLNELEATAAIKEKGSKLSNIVTAIIHHLAHDLDDTYTTIQNTLIQRLQRNSFARGARKLGENLANLIIDGNTMVRRISLSVLLKSFDKHECREILLKANYTDRRRNQVVKKKRAINEARTRIAEKKGIDPQLIEPVCLKAFARPFSNTRNNAVHRRNFSLLARGMELPRRPPTTKISLANMTYAVAVILANSHFRPGRLRNCKVRGSLLKNLPLHLRYSSVRVLWDNYVKSLEQHPKMAIGFNSFVSMVAALTRTGTFNQGLSYYYVDHIDKMNQLKAVAKRVSDLVDNLNGEQPDHVKGLLVRFERQTDLASKYLRHGFYGKLVEDDPNNMYVSAKWALGAVNATIKPKRSQSDPLLLIFTLKPLLKEISDRALEFFVDPAIRAELKSLHGMANVVHKETVHYAKHIIRGWWQERQDGGTMKRLKEEPGTILVVLDHKSKTYPQCKWESMTEYFGKHGMSDLGSMVKWSGTRADGVEGVYVWFFDVVMDNVTSQDARDLMPGIEALLDELESDEFLTIYSETSRATRPSKIVLHSDNALSNRVHTPFIHLLNSRRRGSDRAVIVDWMNNEAQRGKDFLDTHFRYVNMHVGRAVLRGEIKLSDPKAFYKCVAFDGGMKASAVLLLQEKPEAQELLEDCKKVKYNTLGISCVHHISWNAGGDNQVKHRHFSNLETVNDGFKVFEGDDLMPATEVESSGTVLKRSYSKTSSMFLRTKAPGDASPFGIGSATGEVVYEPPPDNIFAGRLYSAANWVHTTGVTPEQLLENTQEDINGMDSKAAREEAEIQSLLSSAKELAAKRNESFPPSLEHYWAKKSNKTWQKPSKELKQKIVDMYNRGKGYKNRAIRYTAEQAVAELRDHYLVDRWDQQVIVTPALMKRKFGSWFQKEKKDADKESKGTVPVATTAEAQTGTTLASNVPTVPPESSNDNEGGSNSGDDVYNDDDDEVVRLTNEAEAAYNAFIEAPQLSDNIATDVQEVDDHGDRIDADGNEDEEEDDEEEDTI